MVAEANSGVADFEAALQAAQQGEAERALEYLEKAAVDPIFTARACARQATLLRQLQRPKESFPMAMLAIKTDMTVAEGWECAGALLIGNKKWPEAENLMALAVKALPQDATLNAYYALALGKNGNPALSYRHAQIAVHLQPQLTPAIMARIEAFCELGYYDLALKDAPLLQGHAAPEAATFSYGSLAFMNGDYLNGLKAMIPIINSGWRYGDMREWNGEPTQQHVAFYGGQGYGDMLQFARYIEPMSRRAGKVTLHVPRILTRLFGDSLPGLQLAIHTDDVAHEKIPMPPGTLAGLPPDVTLRSSLPALATFTDSGFDAMTGSVPYLKTRTELFEQWRARLKHIPKPWIGIVWAPGTWFNSNPSRTISYDTLKPLIDAAKPHLVSLQLGSEAEKAAKDGLFNAAPFITDFADSAALVKELDLLITFDSAPAHLAGGLGTPVWTMLHYNADWRWLAGREDSIWYPSMRLFRQTVPQDWAGVIARMREELDRFLAGDKDVLEPKHWSGPTPVRSPNALPLPV